MVVIKSVDCISFKVNMYRFGLPFPLFYAYYSAQFSFHQVVVATSIAYTFTRVLRSSGSYVIL